MLGGRVADFVCRLPEFWARLKLAYCLMPRDDVFLQMDTRYRKDKSLDTTTSHSSYLQVALRQLAARAGLVLEETSVHHQREPAGGWYQ